MKRPRRSLSASDPEKARERRLGQILLWIERDPELLAKLIPKIRGRFCLFPDSDCEDCILRPECHGE